MASYDDIVTDPTRSGDSGASWWSVVPTLVDAGVDIWNNERNLKYQKETNSKNEQLMRESWAREDNAVQRRVADLKAAGLSPTLAAGSAAASGSPVSMIAPKSNLRGGYGAQTLAALSAIKQLKNQDLQNDLLRKQITNYGKPDWFVALHEILGTDKFEAMLKGFGDKLYSWITGDKGSGGVFDHQGGEDPSTSPSGLVDNIYHESSLFGFRKGDYPSLFDHVDFYSHMHVNGGKISLDSEQYQQFKDLCEITGMSFQDMSNLLWDWYENGGGISKIRNYNKSK